ncbi:MAG: hypothetical protein AABY68_03205 [Pseudomonadota bacterium]
MKPYAIALTALLAGCASHSGIVPMSQGKFMITKQTGNAFLGIGSLKAEVVQEAVSFCGAMDKDMSQVAYDESKPPFILGNYPRVELQFSCVVKSGVVERSGRAGG